MRPRKQDRHLPACMYLKHGAYWLIKKGKWHNLGRDYAEAYAEALQQYAKLQAQPAIKKTGMPELIDNVLSVHLKGLSKKTCKEYRNVAKRLKSMLVEFEPQQIKPKHIAAIKLNLAETPIQCNRLLTFLNIVFNYALEWDLIESNPCARIRKYKEKPRTRYVSHDEFNALLEQLSEPMQRLFTLVYLTGQRISDVLRLKQSDISEAGIFIKQQKTGAQLIIGMTEDIADLLTHLQPNAEGWLFCNQQDRKLSYESARQVFIKARKAAGINDVTIHDLRAKSLTDADREGKDAQKLGGHSNRSMTLRYLRDQKPTEASAPTLPKKPPEY